MAGKILSEMEKRILEVMTKQLLITMPELRVKLSGPEGANGIDTSLQRLMEMGYIEKLESMGTCLIMTQKGLKFSKGI